VAEPLIVTESRQPDANMPAMKLDFPSRPMDLWGLKNRAVPASQA